MSSPGSCANKDGHADIQAEFKEILLKILDVKEEDIVPEARFAEDLGAASIDVVEILTAVENTFDISLPEAEDAEIKTVHDAIDKIEFAMSHKLDRS